MSKIERYQGNVQAFASSAQGVERTVFGETTQANDLTSQITAAFLRGWGIVGPSEHPSLEDFNGAMYALSQFIAYQHQAGIPEWHEEQEYYAGSVCTHTGVAYQSIEDANTGNEPPSAHWTPVITSRNGSEYFQSINATLTALATLAGTKDKMPYFSGEDTAALTALTAFAREILAQTDAAGVLLKLGLGDVNSGRLLNVQVFTSSALYTPTPGTKKAIVEVQGAGGAGAGTNSPATMCAASGSGTSGAYAKAIIDNPTPQQITVGSGGKGGVNNPAGNGNAGGQSSFGSLVTAIGGLGGEAMTAGTGVWSAFFSGTMPAIQFTGASISGRGCGMPTISLRLGGVFSYSGNGGDSIFGAGGIGSRGQSRGGDGVGYGAGGAGANVNGGIAGSFTGGDGADGVVIVWEYM